MANDNAVADPDDVLQKLVAEAKQDASKCNRVLIGLRSILQKEFPEAQLVMFGSSNNGLSLRHSDVDVGLQYETDQPQLEVLMNIKSILIASGLTDTKILDANGTRLVRYTHQESDNLPDVCSFDITFWDTYVGQNSELVRKMCSVDSRFPRLLILLKVWIHNLKKQHGTLLYSHAINLWVICFLQSRDLPVLPKLELLQQQPVWKSENTQTLYGLLMEFFSFWKDFDFQANRISVLQGTPFTTKERTSKFVEIEDPTLPSFNAAVYLRKPNKFKAFREELTKTYEQLQKKDFAKFTYS